MQTRLSPTLLATPLGKTADQVIRSCVHCGFCNATCPTYQLLGDELDGPRGRIYQIKQVLEGAPATATLQQHLDRCLTCRACETTCPSGVEYHKLLDIGRERVEQQVPRPLPQRLQRRLIQFMFSETARIRPLLSLGRLVRPLLPRSLKKRIPPRHKLPHFTPGQHERTMLLLDGCVQPAAAPHINALAIRLFDRLGIDLSIPSGSGCCGALHFHLGDTERARQSARRNIDAWWPAIELGAEAIVSTATGCTPMLKEYAQLLADDPDYAQRAARMVDMTRDLSEVVRDENPDALGPVKGRRIAFHSPCSLQHAQQLDGIVEDILTRAGYTLTPVRDKHLCCGSAGTYSILQPKLSKQLARNKIDALQEKQPELIATANIGCLLQLQAGADKEVVHWVELLADLAPE
ncbi:glycolate oxidase iron-sulfur subunit [Thiogranum longum]|uniref:Glycolate oxidase iron-sulfur subunit n=1 Tax=Thiogranum longum TaxID=1537524 RepID=A0A4R1H9E2_9GAMM|nr:glycolate oxidase subunit GlcF [Thiogranum longum]TCK17908.1 glycolate oxidase iron-sulfur subunit [Thiogranum longum]